MVVPPHAQAAAAAVTSLLSHLVPLATKRGAAVNVWASYVEALH